MTVDQARKAVVADLEAGGFLVETKPYKVPRGRSQRSGAVIEPMLMEQWWVKAKPLADAAIAAVEQGKTKFVPEHYTKTFMHWMTNIEDWCISRQLWWGHQIPAYYCATATSRSHATRRARAARAARARCVRTTTSSIRGSRRACGRSRRWAGPTRRAILQTFYPNNVLVTAPDIIFFWVARMMMMGIHFMGKVPFRTVYLTSTVVDEIGQKMWKTKGNVIDPLDVVNGATLRHIARARRSGETARARRDQEAIKKQSPEGMPAMGADALRFALAALNTGSSRIRLSPDRIKEYRNFINKLWNASRFALMNFDGYDPARFEAQLGRRRAASGSACPSAGSCRGCSTHALPSIPRSRRSASPTRRKRSGTSCGTSCATGTSSSRSRTCIRAKSSPRIRLAPRAATSCKACSRPRSRPRCASCIRSRRSSPKRSGRSCRSRPRCRSR